MAMLARVGPELHGVRMLDTADDPGVADILIYDPQLHALASLKHVRRSPAGIDVAYSWSTRADVVEEARRDGAVVFLSKQLSADELVTAIRALRAGHRGRYLVLPYVEPLAQQSERPGGLTERELEVIELITHGYSNDEIARRLFLSVNSVKSYIRTAYRRIGATRRSQAVLWGIQQGLAPRKDHLA